MAFSCFASDNGGMFFNSGGIYRVPVCTKKSVDAQVPASVAFLNRT
jgi:hypothetical protein